MARRSEPREPISEEEMRAWERELANQQPSQEAWGLLLARLREAAHLEKLQGRNVGLPEGMEAILVTVSAVLDFLMAHEIINRELLGLSLARLRVAIYDLRKGHRPNLFTPQPKGRGRLEPTAAELNLKAYAARALDELMMAGHSQKDAARKVYRVIIEAELPVPDDFSPGSVSRWRNSMKAGVAGKEKVAEGPLVRWQVPLPPEAGDTAQRHADWLLFQIQHAPGFRWR